MADYNPSSNTYTLVDEELDFAIPVAPEGGPDAGVVGNELANELTGNDGDNTLEGLAGNDTLDGGLGINELVGGQGDDTYIVDDLNDIVTEALNAGQDLVKAWIDFDLGTVANVENLTLIGQDATTGRGNDGDNIIIGNDGNNILEGHGGNDTLDGGLGGEYLAGGLGDDVYIVDNVDDIVDEALNEGQDLIKAWISFDLGTVANVENLTLIGHDAIDGIGNEDDNIIVGNDSSNHLEGLAGNDILDGGLGVDELVGGQGDDIYIVDDIHDVVTEGLDEGNDLIKAVVTFDLNHAANVENLTLTGHDAISGTGNDGDNIIIGNDNGNTLTGNGGNDRLDGGLGADQLLGGQGNDTYVVDDQGDTVDEAQGGGIDTVEAKISFSLENLTDIENLTLFGTANIDATGNAGDNTIIGNDGNNTLDGKGGQDELKGGKGNDIYIIDELDSITETEDEGTDTVKASFSIDLNLAKFKFIENIALTDIGDVSGTGTDDDNQIIGNEGNNTLTGNKGKDLLDGGSGSDHLDGGDGQDTIIGGLGADDMVGGADDDLYFVDSAADVVTENATGGTFDRVIAMVSYTLTANVEYLALENAGGNINATGNNLDNTMSGNSGSNILDGAAGGDQLNGATGADTVHGGDGNDGIHESGSDNDLLYGDAGDDSIEGEGGNDLLDGGTGADHLIGGSGNDTYLVDNAFDTVMETPGNGIDTIMASASFALAADAEVEALTATGAGAVNLTGNSYSHTITGNVAANVLRGGDGNGALNGGIGNDKLFGGSGRDTLTGDKGKDTFVFNTLVDKKKTNVDRIADFNVKDDTIQLDNAIFKKVGKDGKLKAGAFWMGAKAHDKDDRIIYDEKKGVLLYDADGSGKAAALQIATLNKHLKTMTYKDYIII